MNKKWYKSSLTKGLWIVVEHLALTAFGLCLAAVLLMGNEISWNMGTENVPYEQSENLSFKMYHSALEILYGEEMKQNFLSEGADGNHVIDLQEFDEDREYTFKNTSGLAYSVTDLKEWAVSSWDFYSGDNVLVCVTPEGDYEYFYYEDFEKQIHSGKMQLVASDTAMAAYGETEEETQKRVLFNLERNILTDGVHQDGILYVTDENGKVLYKDVWNFGAYSLSEKYAPDGADSILEVMNESEIWNGRLKDAYDILGSLLGNIQGELNREKQLENYAEGNTNLTYLYVNLDDKEIYSNQPSCTYGNYETYLKSLKKDAPYVYLRPTLAECETNLVLNENQNLQDWKTQVQNVGLSDDYIFVMQLDDGYAVADTYAESRERYEKYMEWKTPVIQLGVFAIGIFFLGLIWLTVVAGRKKDDEELHLNGFDNWFTEIAAMAVIVVWIAMMGICAAIAESFGTDGGYLLAGGIAGFFTAVFFLLGYLSLVRRIKAGTLWKRSFLRWLLIVCMKMWKQVKELLRVFARSTGTKVKWMLLTGGFLVVQFLLCGIIFSGGSPMVLILLALDVAVLIFFLRIADGEEELLEGLKRIADGDLHYKISMEHLRGNQKMTAEYIHRIGEGLDAAVESSLKNERMKTELITNVSHDIKTPLTSIINYIDLLKRENFTDPKICGYLDVLEAKAQRLKVLTEDVVEASKASTGNISLEMVHLNFVEMIHQVVGEFEGKFYEKHLTSVIRLTEKPVVILADGRRMWRVLENVFNNVVKYAMEGTRVYIDVETSGEQVVFSMKNISAQPLNISAQELTERFIRGDVSRNTEGSGLGLSIAKSLTELQGGNFELYLDGDLFKVIITFQAKK